LTVVIVKPLPVVCWDFPTKAVYAILEHIAEEKPMSETRVDIEEITALESSATWDFDKAEVHPPVNGNRVVVSVAFPGDAFEQVIASAEHLGMCVSAFIRQAALEKATR
jgi:hypothetical protein